MYRFPCRSPFLAPYFSRVGIVAVILALSCGSCFTQTLKPDTLWDVKRLRDTPPESRIGQAEVKDSCTIYEIWYENEPCRGEPTRVFAYLGVPAGDVPKEKRPGILLVHGGGGKAFPKWAEHWAARGYVALAMDLAGCGPDGKRHENPGPGQSHEDKFRDFRADDPADVRDMWTYHAIAAILRGHALLAARPDVDSERIAETGISWGGYLSCILAGVDDRLAACVPVYGCGFLHENSAWLPLFGKMEAERREHWIALFEPSKYLATIRCPILFVNGTNDHFYPPDSFQKTYETVRKHHPNRRDGMRISLTIARPHGHIWTFPEVDAFIDSYCLNTHQKKSKLGFFSPTVTVGENDRKEKTLRVDYHEFVSGPSEDAVSKPERVELCYTTDTGEWEKRKWQSLPADCSGGTVQSPASKGSDENKSGGIRTWTISAVLPTERPVCAYFLITDTKKAATSSPHVELAE